ncbi:sigma-70 family RNA polymerase sigma factor [Stutzerimonas kirkiae]|uniref:sigma-70 family RNA polymerase sigma factor n=1 Tax=Stutzerimonas kirkiae TaxID=2211392 RepID=UPI0010384026|nr:sigma-70 family RNA polymerase sigma factor [Stutzerimonas kirkiae]TBV11985.1 RNA polymerase subunit sigma [Stutzerimonas kirkiae]
MPVDPPHHQLSMLYQAHHAWLQGWLRKRLGDSEHAADLAQDTFMRLLERDELESLRQPRAYLASVAQNVLYNHLRRKKLEQAYLQALARVPEAYAPSLEERAILMETLVALDRLLDGLSVPVRKAFLWSQLEGWTQERIARQLGVSLTTVKRYIVKAGQQCFFADEG